MILNFVRNTSGGNVREPGHPGQPGTERARRSDSGEAGRKLRRGWAQATARLGASYGGARREDYGETGRSVSGRTTPFRHASHVPGEPRATPTAFANDNKVALMSL